MRRGVAALDTGVGAGAVAAVVMLAAAALGGLGWRHCNGHFRNAPRRKRAQPGLTAPDVGAPLGSRATLLQFSSAFCAPCRATRLLLASIAARDPGVAHIELDVAHRMDLVRRLDIRRTPTVFVLGPHGQIMRRASGLPARADVLAALAQAGGQAPARPAAGPAETPHEQIRSDSGHGHA